MDGKEAAKDADKGWWFVIMQVKIFHFLIRACSRGRMQAMIINGLGAIPGTGMESLANRIGT
jgi:hypothetical protein